MTTAATPLTLTCRPRFEGANIRTWVGFKHFMYLVEEAVLQWFREQGAGPQALFHEYGLGLEIVQSSVQLPALLEIDDEVRAEVEARADGRFSVTLHIRRPGGEVLGLRGRATVVLVPEPDAPAPPDALAEFVTADVRAPGVEPAAPAAGFAWPWVARYFHCHYSDRVQHSAYVRALEEVVERFLADRGMSIRTMLDTRGWIPVVSRARVSLVAAAHMEETIHTAFAVRDVLKAQAFVATMDCHVERDGRLVHVATAEILHGYAASRGPDAGRLVVLDPATQDRLLGRAA